MTTPLRQSLSSPLLMEEEPTKGELPSSMSLQLSSRMSRPHRPLHEVDDRTHGQTAASDNFPGDQDDEGDGMIILENQSLGPSRYIRRQQQQYPPSTPPQPAWYQTPHQISAMISNFSTSYNVVNISLVLPILRESLSESMTTTTTGASTSNIDEDAVSAVASSLLAGMMVGQVLGGAVGDMIGPKLALQGVMILQVLASLGSMVSSSSAASPSLVFWHLAAWRFLLGVGAGGVYPLAAVLSVQGETATPTELHENTTGRTATERRNGDGIFKDGNDNEVIENQIEDLSTPLQRVVLTFSMQGLGFIAVPLVAVPLLYTVTNLNTIWRVILGLGSIPGLILLSWQSNLWSCSRSHLSTRHQIVPTQDSDVVDDSLVTTTVDADAQKEAMVNNEAGATLDSLRTGTSEPQSMLDSADVLAASDFDHLPEDMSWWASVRSEPNVCQKLLGTAATWFLFDVLFYGNTLFQPIVIEAAFGKRNHSDARDMLQTTAMNSLILTSIAIPGYAVAGLLLGSKKRWCYCGIEQTPRFVMMQGFAAMSILYLAIGTGWKELRQFPQLLVLLYSLTFFFANYGPNTTTFILPSLVYSPECRSTFNGLSAAAGKLGAFAGASLFEPAANHLGDAAVMIICAAIAGVSLVITKCFVPSTVGHGRSHTIPERERGPDSSDSAPMASRNTIV